MPHPISTVIFDRDGVLTEFDLQAAVAFLRPMVPLSLEELIGHWIAWSSMTPLPQEADAERPFWQGFWDQLSDTLDLPPATRARLYEFDYLSVIHAFPDARPALQAVKARGLQVGVLSNFPLASLGASLATVGLADLIDVAQVARARGTFKPHPEAYQGILTELHADPAACLFFDDELLSVEGARALGMTAYLVDRRYSDHPLAKGIVHDLSAVPAILEARNGPISPPGPVPAQPNVDAPHTADQSEHTHQY